MELVKEEGRAFQHSLNVPEISETFLACLDIRDNSKSAYRKGLNKFLEWLSSNGIAQPDRTDIIDFKACLKESGLAANSVNSHLVAVKRFFAFLEGERKYPNVAKDIKGMKQPKKHLRESLTVPQIGQLLEQFDISTLQGKRDFAMVNLMARTGLRTIEVVRANIGDIKQQGGEALLYIQGKGRDSKDDFVVLTEKALEPILGYLKTRGRTKPGDPLFTSLSDRNKGNRLTTRTIRGIVKEALRAINIDSLKLSAHSLRHSFATLSLRAGAPLLQVKEALRHSSIETTQKYLHNLDRIERAAERYIDF
jgi:integrase/recombinase XerC/integrase/recombinase XerD